MKSRRGNEAEDTREIICAGLGAEAPGVGNAPVPGKPQDIILEFAEALQKTPEFALGPAPAFSGSAFRNGIGGKPLVDQFVVAFEVTRQFLCREGFFPFGLKHLATMTQGLQQLPQQLGPGLVAGLIGVDQFPLQVRRRPVPAPGARSTWHDRHWRTSCRASRSHAPPRRWRSAARPYP